MDGASGGGSGREVRRRPEETVLHEVMRRGWPALSARVTLPKRVETEVRRYLECGQLRRGFLQVQCDECHESRLVAFSCKSRGWCPSCSAKRALETATHLGEVLPRVGYRQWTLTLPRSLRWVVLSQPGLLRAVERRLVRAVWRWQRARAKRLGYRRSRGTCANLPDLDYAVAERLAFPIYLVEAPQHAFLRYELPGGKHINIEATGRGGEMSDEEYIAEMEIPRSAIELGTMMRTLSRREALELLVHERTWHLDRNADLQGLLTQSALLRKLRPTYASVFWNSALWEVVAGRAQRDGAKTDALFAPLAEQSFSRAREFSKRAVELGIVKPNDKGEYLKNDFALAVSGQNPASIALLGCDTYGTQSQPPILASGVQAAFPHAAITVVMGSWFITDYQPKPPTPAFTSLSLLLLPHAFP